MWMIHEPWFMDWVKTRQISNKNEGPLTSMTPGPSPLLDCKNRSGLNSIGFSQDLGSLPMDQAFTNNNVSAGIVYPLMLHYFIDFLEIKGMGVVKP